MAKEKKKKVLKTPKITAPTRKGTLVVNNKKVKKKKTKRGRILNFILGLLMLMGITVMGLVVAFAAYIVVKSPEFNTDLLYKKESSVFYDKNGNEIGRVGAENRELVYYEDLPEVLIDAIIATEDARFFQHNGFDIVRFTKASYGQLKGNKNAGGASTLTMQVVKNTFTSTDASGIEGIIRKFTDIYMSIFLVEKNYTKEEIIEFYVNAPFLGYNTYGVEEASKTYFGKSVKDLSLTEAAILAGIFNAPSNYNPFYSIDLCENRRAIVLDLMVRHGYITEEQADEAKAIPVESLLKAEEYTTLSPYQVFIDMAANNVEEVTGLNPYNTPMEVYTTMDPEVQDIFNKLNKGELGYKWKNDYVQAAQIVTSVKDGSIQGVNGGRNVGARLFNRATDMKTQIGSTAKPIFAYGPFIEYSNGSTGTLFWDNKMTYSNGTVIRNSDNALQGQLTMRQALSRSRNMPAVQAFMKTDKDKIAEFVHGFGIDYGDYLYEAYAIGGGLAISPEEMAAAYGVFARGGYYIKPYSFTKVVYLDSDEVYEYKYTKTRACSPETAYMITDILKTATSIGTAGTVNVPGTDIASKTGTSTYSYAAYKANNVPSSASADNWLITYSPDYVLAMWYGVDKLAPGQYTDSVDGVIQNRKMHNLISSRLYKRNSRFSKPSGVVSSKVEIETFPAQLPSAYTPGNLIITELFKKGTEPSEVSDRFEKLNNVTALSATSSGSNVTLSWNAVPTPNAINTTYLQKYFEDNYGQFANIYYPKRIAYNNDVIGSLGYQVYLVTSGGWQSLGYTTNTHYSYTAPSAGTYTFVVQTAYSNFRANASSGAQVSTNVKGETPPPTPEPDPTPEPNPQPDPNTDGD